MTDVRPPDAAVLAIQLKREEMRLHMAAIAVLVLIGGLVLITSLVTIGGWTDPIKLGGVFGPFLAVGVILLLAATFLVREDIKALADAGLLGGKLGA